MRILTTRSRSAQSSLEMHMTYGFVFIIIIIAIIAAGYYLFHGRYSSLPEIEQIGDKLNVVEAEVYENGIALIFENMEGMNIEDMSVNITGCNGGIGGSADGIEIDEGKRKRVEISCMTGVAGSIFESGMHIIYITMIDDYAMSHSENENISMKISRGTLLYAADVE